MLSKVCTRVSAIIVFCSLTMISSVKAQKAPDRTELNFFGAGNIQKSLDDGSQIPASTGLGVNYIQRYGIMDKDSVKHDLLWKLFCKLELEAAINVASTVDTIVATYDANNVISNPSRFGSSILTPLNSGQAVKISLRLNLDSDKIPLIEGIKLKYIGCNRNWSVMDDGTPRIIQANTNYFRGGFFHEFLPRDYLDEYSINFGIYLAYNSIKGDMGLKANEHIREQVIGTKWKQFVGPEVALEIRLKNLRAEFGYSWLRPNVEVPGLTAGRMVTTITFVGGFGLKLN